MKLNKQFMQHVNNSPYAELLGMRLTKVTDGFARVRMPYHQKLLQPFGRVHGGAIYSMADYALGWAAYSVVDPREEVTTVEVKMNYVGTVRDGELIADATVLHRGSRTILAEVQVKTKSNKLIAKAMGTFMRLNHNGKTPHPQTDLNHRNK